MALSPELVGDVKHHVNPVIGWLRLAEHDGKPLTPGQRRGAIEHLQAAIAVVEEADRG